MLRSKILKIDRNPPSKHEFLILQNLETLSKRLVLPYEGELIYDKYGIEEYEIKKIPDKHIPIETNSIRIKRKENGNFKVVNVVKKTRKFLDYPVVVYEYDQTQDITPIFVLNLVDDKIEIYNLDEDYNLQKIDIEYQDFDVIINSIVLGEIKYTYKVPNLKIVKEKFNIKLGGLLKKLLVEDFLLKIVELGNENYAKCIEKFGETPCSKISEIGYITGYLVSCRLKDGLIIGEDQIYNEKSKENYFIKFLGEEHREFSLFKDGNFAIPYIVAINSIKDFLEFLEIQNVSNSIFTYQDVIILDTKDGLKLLPTYRFIRTIEIEEFKDEKNLDEKIKEYNPLIQDIPLLLVDLDTYLLDEKIIEEKRKELRKKIIEILKGEENSIC